MKHLLSLLAFFLFINFSSAQVTFEKGQVDVNFGVGFPNTTHTAIDGASSILSGIGGLNIDGDENGSSTPFYNLSATYGVVDNIGLGVYLGYFKSDSDILSSAGFLGGLLGVNTDFIGSTEYSVFSVGGKLAVHRPVLGNIKKLDTYASTYLGYNIVSDDTTLDVSNNDTVNGLANELLDNTEFPTFTYEVNAGAKYSISDDVAIFGEAGIGRFLANLGLTYHINKSKSQKQDRPNANDY